MREKPKGGTKPLEKKIAKLEREIAELEAQCADLDERMAQAGADAQKLMELSAERETADEALMEKMEQWEALSTELEAMLEE